MIKFLSLLVWKMSFKELILKMNQTLSKQLLFKKSKDIMYSSIKLELNSFNQIKVLEDQSLFQKNLNKSWIPCFMEKYQNHGNLSITPSNLFISGLMISAVELNNSVIGCLKDNPTYFGFLDSLSPLVIFYYINKINLTN